MFKIEQASQKKSLEAQKTTLCCRNNHLLVDVELYIEKQFKSLTVMGFKYRLSFTDPHEMQTTTTQSKSDVKLIN